MYEDESPTEVSASRSKTDPFLAAKMERANSKRGSSSSSATISTGGVMMKKVDTERRYTSTTPEEHNSPIPDDSHRRFTATTTDEHGGMRRIASSGYAVKKKFHNAHQHSRGGASPGSSSIVSAASSTSSTGSASSSMIGSRSKRKPTVMPRTLSDADKIVGPYVLGDSIGKGGAGVVYKGTHKDTGVVVAVKRVNLRGLQLAEVEALELEFKLLRALQHPHIVSYVEAIRKNGYLHIVLEFMDNGSLNQYFKGQSRASQTETLEKRVAQYVYGVLRGLQYLHHRGVVHRDIKGANILTDRNGSVKLADFGVATQVMGEIGEEAVGTPYWMAPEVIQMSPHTTSCDIWSLGCTVIELITGTPPYFDINPMAAMYRIVQQGIAPPAHFSPELQDFLTQCFQKEAIKRSPADTLLQHVWLKDVVRDPADAQRKCATPGCENFVNSSQTNCGAHILPEEPPVLTEQQSFDQQAYAKQISMIQAQLHNPKGTLRKKQATLRMAEKMRGGSTNGTDSSGRASSPEEKSPTNAGDTGKFSISEWDAQSSGASSIRSDISVGSAVNASGGSDSSLAGADRGMYDMSISDHRGSEPSSIPTSSSSPLLNAQSSSSPPSTSSGSGSRRASQTDATSLLAQAKQKEREREQRLLEQQEREQNEREAAAAAAAEKERVAKAAVAEKEKLRAEQERKEDEARLAKEQEERKKQWVQRVKDRLLRKEGTSFVKNGRRGKPHSRTIKVLPNGILSWGTGRVEICNITRIEPGKQTEVFERNGKADPDKCFSVITAERTLDLEAENKQQRDEWVEGLRRIVAEEQDRAKAERKKK